MIRRREGVEIATADRFLDPYLGHGFEMREGWRHREKE